MPRGIDVAALAPRGEALPAATRAALRLADAYDDYGAGGPRLYLDLTARFARELAEGGGGEL